jgi:ATP-dependent Clp protease ATP-binding subunit ClpA
MQQNRDRFDKFNDHARRVLALAQEEAQRFQHNYIGTEHLLLGLVRLEESTAGQVLNRLGVRLQKVRSTVEFIIGRGDRIVLGEIGLTPRAKKVIELAVDEARRLNHHYIGTEHILLGLVSEGQGIAAGVLESVGVKLHSVRAATLEVLGQAGTLRESDTAGEEEFPPKTSITLTSVTLTGGSEASLSDRLLEFAGTYVRGEKQIDQGAPIIQDADDLVPAPTRTEERANRFTIRARRVLIRAREEARLQQKVLVGSEHLLLALIGEQNGIAFHVLRNMGVDDQQLQTLAQSFVAPENFSKPAETTGLTIDGQRAIELAIEEARLPRQMAIGSEHLLLGLLRGEGSASGLLIDSMGLTLEKARMEVRRLQGF